MKKKETLENINQNGFSERSIDFYYLIGILYKYKKLIIGVTFITGVLSIIYVLNATPYYISRASMYPVNKEEGGILKQLSQTLGISNKTRGYYIFDVLKSKRISSEIIYSKFLPYESKDSINLIQFWNLDKLNISENRKLEAATSYLNSKVSMREDKETALITISAVTKDKILSQAIVQKFCDATVNYMNKTQQSSTSKSVEFTGERLKDVKSNLKKLQNDIVIFQKENASTSSPDLSMEVKKKIQEMELLRSVVVLLGKEHELLKIEKVKDSQVINILDYPDIVDKPVKPQKRVVVMINVFLSFLISFTAVILREKAIKYGVLERLKNEVTKH